jgi:hypothetical protein
MRELVALTQRVELRWPGKQGTVLAGFHRDGRLSVYFGEDPYYQFDPAGRLRRALVDGRLFRTQGNGLAALTRARGRSTTLARHDLDQAELQRFSNSMLERVAELRAALAAAVVDVVRQVPEDVSIKGRLVAALDAVLCAAGKLAPAINKVR